MRAWPKQIAISCVFLIVSSCHTAEIVGPFGDGYSDTGYDVDTGSLGDSDHVDDSDSESDSENESDSETDFPGHLFQHLDATAPGSVLTDSSGVLTRWNDLSPHGHHATPSRGQVLYPSDSLSPSGLSGLDFGLELNELQLLTAPLTTKLLDFSNAGQTEELSPGLTVFIVFWIHELPENQMFLLGTRDTRGSFSLKLNKAGRIVATLADTYDAHGSELVAPGDTIVAGMSYDAATGYCRVWESKNNDITDDYQTPYADLDADVDLRLGDVRPADGSVSFLRGVIGEVKIFNRALGDLEFDREGKDLVTKWIE